MAVRGCVPRAGSTVGDHVCFRPARATRADRRVGADASRRLWFARQAAAFIHALDVAELLDLDESSMAQVRRDGLRAFVESVEDCPYRASLTMKIDGWIARDSHPTLDALFSVLWRAKWPVIELFPGPVRSIVEAKRL